MLIFAVAALVGMLAGLVLGGRFAGLADVRLRAAVLVWAALAVQLSLGLGPLRALPDGTRFVLVVASYGGIGVWLALNAAGQDRALMRGAFGLLATGWLLNLVVMVPNGGMPVSAGALADSGAPVGFDVEEGHLWKHVELSPSTVLPALGDVVAVPALRSAVSVGDLVLVVGVAMVMVAGMLSRQGERRPLRLATARHVLGVDVDGAEPLELSPAAPVLPASYNRSGVHPDIDVGLPHRPGRAS